MDADPRQPPAHDDETIAESHEHTLTPDEWFDEAVDREEVVAERALELTGTDEVGAEEIFDDRRRPRDDDIVPSDERPV
jgi:hypothetical protein